jgi:hypothetical protein
MAKGAGVVAEAFHARLVSRTRAWYQRREDPRPEVLRSRPSFEDRVLPVGVQNLHRSAAVEPEYSPDEADRDPSSVITARRRSSDHAAAPDVICEMATRKLSEADRREYDESRIRGPFTEQFGEGATWSLPDSSRASRGSSTVASRRDSSRRALRFSGACSGSRRGLRHRARRCGRGSGRDRRPGRRGVS